MKGIGSRIIVRNKKIALLMATVLCVSATPVFVSATSTKDKLEKAQEEKKKTEQELNEVQEEKENLEIQKNSLKGKLNELNQDLTKVSTNIEILEQQIADKKAQIEQTGLELDEAIRIKDKQYEEMKIRIKYIYESQDYVLLEMLFDAADFSDFLNRNDYIEQLSEYDRRKLQEFKECERLVAEKEAALIEEKKELDEYLVEVQAEQAAIAGMVGKTANSITQYQGQISKAEQEMLDFEQRLKEQSETIEQLNKQLEEERRLSALAAQSVWRNISDVTFAEGDRYLLANLIYCEAANQPDAGQVAVGAVVINRMLSPVFPDTIVGVIYQNKQFSPVASGRLALALAENRATPACYKAADDAMKGASTVGNCLFFRTPIEGVSGTVIGGHVFY